MANITQEMTYLNTFKQIDNMTRQRKTADTEQAFKDSILNFYLLQINGFSLSFIEEGIRYLRSLNPLLDDCEDYGISCNQLNKLSKLLKTCSILDRDTLGYYMFAAARKPQIEPEMAQIEVLNV